MNIVARIDKFICELFGRHWISPEEQAEIDRLRPPPFVIRIPGIQQTHYADGTKGPLFIDGEEYVPRRKKKGKS